MDERELVFPVAAKAASGIMGFMFRKIGSIEELKKYHGHMTANYIVQEYVTYPIEVSVFYYRYPNQQRGTITGFIRKELPEVVGDGASKLWDLIKAHPRVQFKLDEMKNKHAAHLDEVVDEGQRYPLSQAFNLSRGARLVSLEDQKDEKLLELFDMLSHHSGKLYFGRYDIRCNSVVELKEKKNFTILEFNGCGGEPHHVYGNNYSLLQACKIILHHWKVLYEISKYNHHHGYPRWKNAKAIPFFRKSIRHIIQLKKLDKSLSFDAVNENSISTNTTLSRAEIYT